MSDLWTMGNAQPGEATTEPAAERERRPGRRISRPRQLPGSRAVVGALLVTAAAVGVFSAYLNATAEPATAYVVALDDIPIGTVLTDDVLRDAALFGLVPLDLPAEVASGAVTEDRALGLEGQVTAAPIASGDLISRSGLLDASASDGTARLSFSIPPSRAVGGGLEPGDRIDLVATFGSGGDVVTRYVAQDVLLADVIGVDGGLSGNELVLTLALDAGEQVLDVAQAVDVAEVFVVRSPLALGEAGSAGAVEPPTDIPQEPVDEEPPLPDEEPADEGPDDEEPADEEPAEADEDDDEQDDEDED